MPFPPNGRFSAVLLLDRTRTDQQIAHYAWLRLFVVGAGGIVLLSVALAWRAAVRLADARGRAQLLEIEARHLHELSQAAAGLAHETRNPLGLIRGWTQRWMQQATTDSPQQRQQAQAVIEECDRVTARINQFLAFARPCAPSIAAVRPGEVVAELAALLEPDLSAKRLALRPDLPAADRPIRADRELLRQALFNLIQNAIQFSPEGGTVEITMRPGPNGDMRLEVADRGRACPPTRPICCLRRTIRLASAAQGWGWPSSAALPPPTAGGPATRRGPAAARSSGWIGSMTDPQRTILVVDDDAAQRRLLGDFIGSLGFRSDEANSAEAALERIGRRAPDMVCSTCVCRAWTASPRWARSARSPATCRSS